MGSAHLEDRVFGQDVEFNEFETELLKIVEQKLKILIKKKELRGTENINRQGLMGVVTRISEDKLERIKRAVGDDYLVKTLRARGIDSTFSSSNTVLKELKTVEDKLQLEDDLMDIANYCDIMVLMLRGQWK